MNTLQFDLRFNSFHIIHTLYSHMFNQETQNKIVNNTEQVNI